MRRTLLALTLALTAAPALAQTMPTELSGKGSAADIAAGAYTVEPGHTQVDFTISHMGISPFSGTLSGASGSMTIDPANLSATKLDVTIPLASIQTTSDKLTGELKSADWFDAEQYPTAKFHATKVEKTGAATARITGDLTLHGVTKPITIAAKFYGAAMNPMSKKASLGFTGRAMIQRSQFGIDKYVPLVSDETMLTIHAAFEKQ
ncbi:YceI family protein [Stakelama sp. CBK3Z-3]|uniref:YceI family protein n=1 Tax=Stakelama flava TaxID=2860338 RepID=A0ABS6XJF9_9SPHN|nr:YceI family protein [Stakelama flava]MBW4329595.1 YceI family protein [Stakelama flava]